jgi:hypothetical protein
VGLPDLVRLLLPEELLEARQQPDAAARPARAVRPARREVRRILVARGLPPAGLVAALDARAARAPERAEQRAVAARQEQPDAVARRAERPGARARPVLPA